MDQVHGAGIPSSGNLIIGRRTFAHMFNDEPDRIWFASGMTVVLILVHFRLFRATTAAVHGRVLLCSTMSVVICRTAGIRAFAPIQEGRPSGLPDSHL